MKGNIFSPEDKEFMEVVQLDLRRYLQKNIFPSRTVLVFPPFNGFRRFLIHKLIEDNFASSEVAAFSIGQDISRRIVICYKGLISEAASKGLPATIPQPPRPNMIDKEKPNRHKQTPTAAVYRPPAARLAENRKSTENIKPSDTKLTRTRRPDQQMYVPRPKRASYGSDLPRSRSRSNSRLSLDSDQSLEMKRTSLVSNEEPIIPRQNGASQECSNERILTFSTSTEAKKEPDNSYSLSNGMVQPFNEGSMKTNDIEANCTTHIVIGTSKPLKACEISESEKIGSTNDYGSKNTVTGKSPRKTESQNESEMQVDSQDIDNDSVENSETQNKNTNIVKNTLSSNHSKSIMDIGKKELLSNEAMDTISISSDSRNEDSSSSSSFRSSDSKTSHSSVESDIEKKSCEHRDSEKMDIDNFDGNHSNCKSKSRAEHKDGENIKKAEPTTTKVLEVLVISDSSSSDDSMKSAEDDSDKAKNLEKPKDQNKPVKVQDVKIKSSSRQSKMIDPNECDWESLYDDSGECLVPSLMEELTNSIGKVRVTSANSDYRPYQSIEERTNDGECVIEIYDFPAEFKTTDLFNVFAAYRNKNFQIKWVDDTHALGIFPSPLMADEVLACTLPFVKTRPLRLGIAESRTKARNLVLPPLPSLERPKTCTALARRLVTGALGLRIPTSSQEREKEKQVLKEAREKRRLEAKQREAAWDGSITSNNVL